jgi:hypothetical protein
MRRILPLFALAALAAAGCEPSYTYQGYTMHSQFPTDGERYWEYANEDSSIADEMRVEMVTPPRTEDTLEIFTFEHYNDSTGDLLYSVDWSSDAVKGIQIHGYSIAVSTAPDPDTGGEDTGTAESPPAESDVDFDPPILFAESSMAPGDTVETETGGYSFVSTLEYSEACPNYWSSEWTDCLRMKLDDGDGDDSVGAKVAGTYWLVKRYGIAWFQQTGDDEKWVLRKASWQPDSKR